MKSSSLRILALAGVMLAGAAAASAQDFLTATVPFPFTAADSSMARGTYRVSPMSGMSGAFAVTGARGGAFVLGQPDSWTPGRPQQAPSLLFHRYGTQNFLREIRFDDGTVVILPETKQERDAAERRVGMTFERIEILARS